jgi:hypothetical protein
MSDGLEGEQTEALGTERQKFHLQAEHWVCLMGIALA